MYADYVLNCIIISPLDSSCIIFYGKEILEKQLDNLFVPPLVYNPVTSIMYTGLSGIGQKFVHLL